MKQQVVNADKASVGDIELADHVFGVSPVKPEVIAQVVNWQLACRRAGTHATKGRSDVQGSTRKISRQKGGGRARHGSIRAPQFRGGGVVFGPVVRDHGYKLNKKVRSLGLRMALSGKAADKELLVLDALPGFTKTKEASAMLGKLEASSAVFVTADKETAGKLRKVVGNIPNIDVLPVEGVNAYSLLRRQKLVVLKDAVQPLQERFASCA